MGITNGNHNSTNDTSDDQNFKQSERFSNETLEISPTKVYDGTEEVRTKRFAINRHVYERQILRMRKQRVRPKRETAPTNPPRHLKLPFESFHGFERGEKKFIKNQNLLQKVQVLIHNLSQDDDDPVDSNKIDVSIDKSNQTEIIYSVIVNGKPVLASTAAEDMRLVKLDEVEKIMEKDIVLKAEREWEVFFIRFLILFFQIHL